jgi:glycyl-tRNA synthetase beta chain
MIHHQHYFPVVDEEGKLKPAFLAVTNTQAEKPEIIARNSERVLTARLRDARFFWDEDRQANLESRIDRLSTILFHKKLGSYKEKAERVSSLAGWIARDLFKRPDAASHAEVAGRLAKADLATGMVREFTELQGTMGGIYAREEGQPEQVWKAIYYHYLPIGVEADAPPSKQQLGVAAVTWTAVSLADKIDSVVGMFWAGERPRGSRDPLGIRRLGNGLVKILVDLPNITAIDFSLRFGDLIDKAQEPFTKLGPWNAEDLIALSSFFVERCQFVLEQRGFDIRNVRSVTVRDVRQLSSREAFLKLQALEQMRASQALMGVATLFKRAKNITKGVTPGAVDATLLNEPAEKALMAALAQGGPIIRETAQSGDYRRAFTEIAALEPAVAKFFDDVLVMAEDEKLRQARLTLVATLRDLILDIADLSEIAPETA